MKIFHDQGESEFSYLPRLSLSYLTKHQRKNTEGKTVHSRFVLGVPYGF